MSSNNTIKHRGIVILGCPRSGTTLIRRILDAHPNISAPGETYLLTACARFLHSDISIDGMHVGVLNGLGFSGFEKDEVIDRLRNFAFEFKEQHARREGKSRWVEKTAVDAFHVDAIEQMCGDDAYFICVARHGLDVAVSMNDWCFKSNSYPEELHSYIRAYPQPMTAFCHAWADATNAICDFAGRHPDNAIFLRYEDLAENAEGELQRIVEFIGESWRPTLIAQGLAEGSAKGFSDWKTFSKDSIERTSVGRWKNLPSGTLAELAPVANPTLQRCGYDEVQRSAASPGEMARRRYEMGLRMQSMKRSVEPQKG